VQGVSTRKVKAVAEELCGHGVSASTIGEINKKMDEELVTLCINFFYIHYFTKNNPILCTIYLYHKKHSNISQNFLSNCPFPWEAYLFTSTFSLDH
jgi:mutator family transposase